MYHTYTLMIGARRSILWKDYLNLSVVGLGNKEIQAWSDFTARSQANFQRDSCVLLNFMRARLLVQRALLTALNPADDFNTLDGFILDGQNFKLPGPGGRFHGRNITYHFSHKGLADR